MCLVLEICPPLHLPQGEVKYNKLFPANQYHRVGLQATFSCPSGYILHGTRGAYCSNSEKRWKNNVDNSQNAVCAGIDKLNIKLLIESNLFPSKQIN